MGKEQTKGDAMKTAERVRAFDDAEALGAIERALHGKLRAHRLSEGFIDRHGEDVLQQALAEYERAVADESEIDAPDRWIVFTAYRRAIDELRREMHEEPDGGLADAPGAISGGDPATPTESEALANVSTEQLRAAMAKLSAQQRQALGLYYFEELPTREAAEALGCGQTTFRRRLDSALRVLRQRFGISVPEPGEELAIEVGLAAWLSLSGARVVPTRGLADQLLAAADALRGATEGLLGRGRDAAARVLASGGGEGIGAAASGSLGKATGGLCAGALTACALSGVIGPGVGGLDLTGGHDRARRPEPVRRHVPSSGSLAAEGRAQTLGPESPPSETSASRRTPSGTSGSSTSKRKRDARQVREQTDGLARAASESSIAPAPSASPVSASSAEATDATSAAPSGSSAGTSATEEEAQAKQQFGAFK